MKATSAPRAANNDPGGIYTGRYAFSISPERD